MAESQQQSKEPIIIEEIPIADDQIDDSAAIQEAVVVDENTGDSVPVVLVDEELVEQALQGLTDVEEAEPLVLVETDKDLPKDNSTKIETQLTEAAMAKEKEEEEQKGTLSSLI